MHHITEAISLASEFYKTRSHWGSKLGQVRLPNQVKQQRHLMSCDILTEKIEENLMSVIKYTRVKSYKYWLISNY
jgi:hypothetical protein